MTLEELQAEIKKLNKIIAEKDAVIQQKNTQIENMLQTILHTRSDFDAKSETNPLSRNNSACSRMNRKKYWQAFR